MAVKKFKNKRATVKNNTDKIQNQVNNYKTRLENIGINPEEATDTRNALEKALNLEKDQNVLFDIFEILDRPRNALFTGINEAAEGGSFLEGLKEGFFGETETSGKDLLTEQLGMYDEKGKLNLSDVLGFGLDIVGDPTNWALPGVKSLADLGVDVAKKGLKTTAKVADKALTKGLQVLDNAELDKLTKKAAQAGVSVDDLVKQAGLTAADFGKRTQGYKAIKEGAKDIFAQGSTTLGKLRAGKRAATGSNELVDEVFSKYRQPLEELSYDYVLKNSTNLGKYGDDITKLNNYLQKQGNTISKWINENPSNELAKALVSEQDVVAQDILNMLQNTKDTTIKGKNAIRELIETGEFSGSEDSVRALKELIDQSSKEAGLKINTTPGLTSADKAANITSLEDSIKSGLLDEEQLRKAQNDLTSLRNKNSILTIDDKNALKELYNNPTFRSNVDNLALNYNLEYNADELARLNELSKNENFMNLVRQNENAYKDVASQIRDITGMDYSDIVNRQGYVRKAQGTLADIDDRIETLTARLDDPTLTDADRKTIQNTIDTLRQESLTTGGRKVTKSFSSQKYKQPAVVANRQYQEAIQKQSETIQKQINNLKEQYSATARESLTKQLDELKSLKTNSEKIANLNKKLSKQNTSLDNITSKIDETNVKIKDITNRVTDNIIDKSTKIQDQSVTKGLVKDITNIDNLNKQVKKLTKQLTDVDNLDDATVKSITQNIDELNIKLQEAGLDLRKTTAIIDGHVDDTIMKTVDRNVKDMQRYADEVMKLDKLKAAKQQAAFKVADVQESIVSLNNNIDKTIKNINFKLENINELNDRVIDDRIAALSKAKSLLDTEAGQTLFNLNFYAGLDDFVKNAKYTNETAHIFKDALAMDVFNDPNVIKTINQMGDEIPNGWVKVSGKNLSNRLNSIQTIISDGKISDELQKVMKQLSDNDYYMDSRMASLFGTMAAPKENTNALLNLVDKFNNTFKKFSVLTPGFQVRNYTGNTFNMYLSGVPVGSIPKYQAKATKVLNSLEDIKNKIAQGIKLTADEENNWKLFKQFYEGGFNQAGTAVQDLQKVQESLKLGSKTNVINKLSDINMKMNNDMDAMNRMALLMYANDNPKYLAKLGAKTPIQAVKYALMDPSNMSDVEQKLIKKIIPFYTFTKQNLMFQASNLTKNVRKYKNVMRALQVSYDDLGEDSYYQYQKESMQLPIPSEILGIPLPFPDDDGNQLFLKANLPLSDLGEFLENPVRRLTASATPIIKAPVEAVTGKNLFTGQDIKYDTFSNNLSKLGVDSTGITNAAQGAELILNNFGLQNVSTNIIKKVQAILENSTGEKSSNELWAEIFRSVLQNTKEENVRNSGLYDEMEQYQAIVKQLKNQGIDVPTIKEMTASNSLKLNNLKRKRASSR